MVDGNNPAELLEEQLRLLEEADQNLDAVTAWCSVWGLAADTAAGSAECLRRMAEVMELAVVVRREASAQGTPGERALEGFDAVEGAVRTMALRAHKTGDLLNAIGPGGWRSLSRLSTLLSRAGNYSEIGEDVIADLVDQTRALIDSVVGATDLSASVRRDLLRHLEEVERTLLRAQIVSASGVRLTQDGLLGVLVRLHMTASEVAKHPLIDATFQLVLAMAVVAGLDANSAALMSATIETLRQIEPRESN